VWKDDTTRIRERCVMQNSTLFTGHIGTSRGHLLLGRVPAPSTHNAVENWLIVKL
jgi:hypothetical protein